MNMSKHVSTIFAVILIVFQLTACGASTLTPIPILVTSTKTPHLIPTIIPLFTPSPAPSTTPTIPLTSTTDVCNSAQWRNKIQVISQDRFDAIGPGPTVYDRILVAQNPAWADFQQYQHGEIRSAGVIFHETAFGPELGTGISPAVLLVTYGVDKKWELPANGDLVTEVDRIRAVLHQRERYWIVGTIDTSQYPMIANAATYALYHYFSGDLSKLEDWCRTYVRVFNESPLK